MPEISRPTIASEKSRNLANARNISTDHCFTAQKLLCSKEDTSLADWKVYVLTSISTASNSNCTNTTMLTMIMLMMLTMTIVLSMLTNQNAVKEQEIDVVVEKPDVERKSARRRFSVKGRLTEERSEAKTDPNILPQCGRGDDATSVDVDGDHDDNHNGHAQQRVGR